MIPSKGYGYHEAFTGCKDVNECTDGNFPSICGGNTDCANNVGSHTCTCKSGYTAWQKHHGCRDINECCQGSHSECTHTCQRTAPDNGICFNTGGSFDCRTCSIGGTLLSTSGQGQTFTSHPDYDFLAEKPYGAGAKEWTLSVPAGKRVELTVKRFNVGL